MDRPEAVEVRAACDIPAQRWRAGAAVRSEQARADLSRFDDPAAAEVQRLLRRDGREASERRDLAPRVVRPHCRQAPLDATATAGAPADLDGHQAHLRRGLELYRRLDRRAAARLPGACRRRSQS